MKHEDVEHEAGPFFMFYVFMFHFVS